MQLRAWGRDRTRGNDSGKVVELGRRRGDGRRSRSRRSQKRRGALELSAWSGRGQDDKGTERRVGHRPGREIGQARSPFVEAWEQGCVITPLRWVRDDLRWSGCRSCVNTARRTRCGPAGAPKRGELLAIGAEGDKSASEWIPDPPPPCRTLRAGTRCESAPPAALLTRQLHHAPVPDARECRAREASRAGGPAPAPERVHAGPDRRGLVPAHVRRRPCSRAEPPARSSPRRSPRRVSRWTTSSATCSSSCRRCTPLRPRSRSTVRPALSRRPRRATRWRWASWGAGRVSSGSEAGFVGRFDVLASSSRRDELRLVVDTRGDSTPMRCSQSEGLPGQLSNWRRRRIGTELLSLVLCRNASSLHIRPAVQQRRLSLPAPPFPAQGLATA